MAEIEEIKEIRDRVSRCLPNASEALRAIDKAQIIATVKANYTGNGPKLPLELKRRLAKEFHFSEKTIENLVYDSRTEFESI